jgi:hypothetical protein
MNIPTDKDGNILHDLALVADSAGHFYYIPSNIESEFEAWVSTGRADDDHGEFDDFRVSPEGAITKLMFSRSLVN